VDLALGALFFVLACISSFVLSIQLCALSQHYVDGLFVGASLTLLAVMMVYKYWDGITNETPEFSIALPTGEGGTGWDYPTTTTTKAR
jgi:hypothetical protein